MTPRSSRSRRRSTALIRSPRLPLLLPALCLAPAALAREAATPLSRGIAQVEKLAGCYVVDYSFTEVEALKPGYALDTRVYDVNVGKTTRELVIPLRKSPTEIRLQHVLFSTGADGKAQFVMKHQAEDWAFEAPFLYDFVGPGAWEPRALASSSGLWTRKVTNLDDGLRYQCAAPWDFSKEQAEWKCGENYAPVPGRETRDMGRKDYDALARSTHIIDYGASFLERQDNVKTIHAGGARTPLARELGKTWYVRQPKSACAPAEEWAAPRLAYWAILMEEWEAVFREGRALRETPTVDGQPRWAVLGAIEEKWFARVQGDPSAERAAREEIRAVLARSLGSR